MFVLVIFAIIIVVGAIGAAVYGTSRKRLLSFKTAEVSPLYRCPGTPISVAVVAEGPVEVRLNVS